MRTSHAAEAYLTFPVREEIPLGGMQWSHDCDAVEDASGRTVCLVEQLQEVLHGAYSSGSIPHFTHIMYLLRAMKFGGTTPAFARLKQAYADSSTAAAFGRNTGALIAHLSSPLPPLLAPPTLDELLETLAARRRHGLRLRTELRHDSSSPLAEAAPQLAARIDSISDENLRHWLRFGRPGLERDDRIAEEFERLPLRVLKLIAAARTAPRLVGAASLIPALDAALVIPPRKRSPDAVPQGGYSDVTTRGDPDRLLPSQFALDPDEFVRRFAERELLYFQREEPHETQKPERVLVFDQGVRAWGRVRLALTGAVLSLLKFDARRIADARLYVTSQPEFVELQRAEIEKLMGVLEASDFTETSAEAFGRALEEISPNEVPRDLIVLTHPKNALSILESAQARRPGDRIFTLTVDDDGTTKLGELREEGFVWLRSFRLDLQAASEERVDEATIPATVRPFVPWKPWAGDVEPVGFPFRPGIVADVDVMGFTVEGDWLVTASKGGVLHAIACDGSGVEVLPRAFRDGKLQNWTSSILAVSGGVVVGAYPNEKQGHSYVLVLTHYDFRNRTVRSYSVPKRYAEFSCIAQPDYHCVMVYETVNEWVPKYVVDLRIEQVIDFPLSKMNTPSAAELLQRRQNLASPYPLKKFGANETIPSNTHGPFLFIDRHLVTVRGTDSNWETFSPRSNGKPVLEEAKIEDAQLADQTLALTLSKQYRKSNTLILFRAPDGRILMEFERPAHAPFTLSPDGEMIARRRGRREVAVQVTAQSRDPLAVATQARLHDMIGVRIVAVPFQCMFFIGSHEHTFTIQEGKLVHEHGTKTDRGFSHTYSPCPAVEYDTQRFTSKMPATNGVLQAATDRIGLVHLIASGTTLIASFCIRRELAAAWIPGGIFWGSPALIGGPPHPNAAELIGTAIMKAGGAS